MVFIGLEVDNEARSFMEPFQLMTRSLHGAEFGVEPGSSTGEGDNPGFDVGDRVKAEE